MKSPAEELSDATSAIAWQHMLESMDKLRVAVAQEREGRIAAELMLRGILVADGHTGYCPADYGPCEAICSDIRHFLGLDAPEPSAGTEAAT